MAYLAADTYTLLCAGEEPDPHAGSAAVARSSAGSTITRATWQLIHTPYYVQVKSLTHTLDQLERHGAQLGAPLHGLLSADTYTLLCAGEEPDRTLDQLQRHSTQLGVPLPGLPGS
jgi:hypothetical protein